MAKPFDASLKAMLEVWELSPDALLAGGLATLPLAPIGATVEGDLPRVVARMGERFDKPEAKRQAPELWAASSILMGLKYERALIERLITEVRGMAESVTIDIFKEWGAKELARKIILQQGTVRFGEPPDAVKQAIERTEELTRLVELATRLLQVDSWDELLAPPTAAKPKKPAAKPAPRRKK